MKQIMKDTPKNRKKLEKAGYGSRQFNWEEKNGSYLMIVSSDSYLLITKKHKLMLELDDIEAKETSKRKKWHKYEDAGCHECNLTGLYRKRHGSGATAYVDKIRCNCTYEKTARYAKALNNDELSVKEYKKKLKKFKDNNKKYKNEYGTGGRSWDD